MTIPSPRAVRTGRRRPRRDWSRRTNPLLGASASPSMSRRSDRPVRLRQALGLAALGTMMLLGLRAFFVPAVSAVRQVERELELVATTDYRVWPRSGVLYDSDAPLNGREAYFTRLAERVEVIFRFAVTGRPEVPTVGGPELSLTLRAPGLWEKALEAPPASVRLGERDVEVVAVLEPAALAELVRAIVAETGVQPDTPCEARLLATLEGELGDTGLQAVMRSHFCLVFRPDLEAFLPRFEPSGRVRQFSETVERRPNHLAVLGMEVAVVPARLGGLAAFGLLVAGLAAGKRRRPYRSPPAARKVRGALAVRGLAAELRRLPRLYLDDLDELGRLADRRRLPVLGAAADEPPLFCVLDGGIAYIYVPDARPRDG